MKRCKWLFLPLIVCACGVPDPEEEAAPSLDLSKDIVYGTDYVPDPGSGPDADFSFDPEIGTVEEAILRSGGYGINPGNSMECGISPGCEVADHKTRVICNNMPSTCSTQTIGGVGLATLTSQAISELNSELARLGTSFTYIQPSSACSSFNVKIGCGTPSSSSALGETTIEHAHASGVFTAVSQQTIRISGTRILAQIAAACPSCPASAQQAFFQNVVRHEMLHGMMVGHSNTTGQLMSPNATNPSPGLTFQPVTGREALDMANYCAPDVCP